MRSLGYAFTRRIARTAWMELVPESVITLAPCLAPFVPDGWAIRHPWSGSEVRGAR
ncbi:MAG TPA: hypothetical protein VFQ53_35790 [Kofleriaceae bacterium]|nr:hypothetical protein [Kofleriaceae bacterium]